jgi:hypothetical protein
LVNVPRGTNKKGSAASLFRRAFKVTTYTGLGSGSVAGRNWIMADDAKVVKPVWAHVGETVEIHWRRPNGSIFVERRTAPPDATQNAKGEPEHDES